MLQFQKLGCSHINCAAAQQQLPNGDFGMRVNSTTNWAGLLVKSLFHLVASRLSARVTISCEGQSAQ